MATINGLKVKKLKTFFGHEGEICDKGKLYLEGVKIASWKNSAKGPNTYEFEPGYSEVRLRELIQVMYPCAEGGIPYDLDLLIADLVELKLSEKTHKNHLKRSKKFPVTAILSTDYDNGKMLEHEVSAMYYFDSREEQPDDAYFKKSLLKLAKESEMHHCEENCICITFRSLDDFTIGDPISLKDISV